MAIYAKKINGKQRKALKQMEHITGFEPLYQNELDSGEYNFNQVWNLNIEWFESVLAEVSNIRLKGC